MPTPIERLQNLSNVEIRDAGMLLLAAILTPVVTFFDRVAAFIEAMFGLPITVVGELSTGLGMLVISLLAGAAGVIDAAFGAAEMGFAEGVWGTLGPFAPAIGLGSVLGAAALAAYYYRMEATADSPLGLFSATDFPLIGADEEE